MKKKGPLENTFLCWELVIFYMKPHNGYVEKESDIYKRSLNKHY